MDITQLGLFRMLNQRMAHNSARQDVLAQNIANVDTPGYKGYDIKELSFKRAFQDQQKNIRMEQTSPMHNRSTREARSDFRPEKVREPYEKKLTANRINLEEQMMKVSENAFEYQTALNVYKKTTELMTAALGSR